MVNVEVDYLLKTTQSLDSEDLEKLAKLNLDINTVKKYFESQRYKEVNFAASIMAVDFIASYFIQLESESIATLQSALEKLVNKCGVPDFVSGNYEVADKVLEKYGKKTIKRPDGMITEREVVDV